MLNDRRSRLLNNPVFKVARWTIPWVLLAVVAWYLWGFYSEFKMNERTVAASFQTAEEKAMQTSATVDTTASAEATSVPAGTIGVALVDGVKLRTTASAKGQVSASVGKGTKLVLLEKSGDWYRVRSPLGHIGWVSGSDKLIQITKQ